jgi:hypothetical protein
VFTYILIIDGMEQEINSCANNEIRNATFSGKKSYPTFTKLI